MKKLIFISLSKTHTSMIERFYLDLLYANGFDIEYWDLRSIFYDENSDSKYPFIHKVNSLQEFKLKLASLDKQNVIVNMQISYEFKYLQLFLNTRKFIRSFYSIGNFPKYHSSVKSNLFLKVKKIFSKRVFEKLIEIVFRKLFLEGFDICFYAGKSSKNIVNAKKYFPINYIDYEKQKTIKAEKKDFKYVVFLDQNLHAHPDFKEIGFEYIDKEQYFGKLKELFQNIEKKFGFKILIALHPTSELYDFYPYEFQIKERTAELLHNCEFAMGHFSTSLYSAVSAYKPIILLSLNEMESKIPYSSSLIDGLKNELSLTKINLDETRDILDIPRLQEKCYRVFLDQYCTTQEIKHSTAEEYFVKYLK